ncbi:MAG: nickel-dependent lactate racemase [Myxococcota bacterium]
MEYKLKYGKEEKKFELPEKNVLGIIKSADITPLASVAEEIAKKLKIPDFGPSLFERVKSKKARSAVIVVNDYTRAVPYYKENEYNLLKDLADELERGGIRREKITFLVATGTHRAHTVEENEKNFSKYITDNYNVVSHDCDKNNVSVGRTKQGHPIEVDKLAVETDILVLTGLITTHYFGGVSGGRKSILPGIASRETVRCNHAMIAREGVSIGALDGNPISEEMDEASEIVKPDFLVNFLINDNKKVTHVLTGDVKAAHRKGAEILKELYTTPYPEKADVVFASAGGHPKDVSLYQSQKTVNNCKELVKKGGTIVILARCEEGFGSKSFQSELSVPDLSALVKMPEEKIIVGGHTAVNTAKLLMTWDFYIISEINKEELERSHFKHANSIEEAIAIVRKKHGDNFKAYIVPNGGFIYPLLKPKV